MRLDCRKEQKYAAPAKRSGAAAIQVRQKSPREAKCPRAGLPPCRVFGPSTKRGSRIREKISLSGCERQAGLPACGR